jgi:hypothetical protein
MSLTLTLDTPIGMSAECGIKAKCPAVVKESILSRNRFTPHRRASRGCNYLTPGIAAASFDDPNLVSTAGLVPVMALAQASGLLTLADEHLSVPTDKGAHAGHKVGSLVGGMVAGVDSVADTALPRHGAMGTVFDRP